MLILKFGVFLREKCEKNIFSHVKFRTNECKNENIDEKLRLR